MFRSSEVGELEEECEEGLETTELLDGEERESCDGVNVFLNLHNEHGGNQYGGVVEWEA